MVAWRKTHQPASDKNTCSVKCDGGSRCQGNVDTDGSTKPLCETGIAIKAYKTVCEEKPYGVVEIKKKRPIALGMYRTEWGLG